MRENKKSVSTKPKKEKITYKFATQNDMEAAKKVREAKAQVKPNRLPFDQGTSI